MANLTLSANMDSLLASADYSTARSNLGLSTLATTTPGTGVATALAINTGTAGAIVVLNGAYGTPSGINLSNATSLPLAAITGLGTSVNTALAVNVGSAGAFVVLNGALGTPSSGTLSSCTGLPISTGVSGLGTGIATWLATPSGANLASALTTALPATKGGTGLTSLGTNVTTLLGTDLTDPNADRILFWDDSAGGFAYLTAGTGLSISGTTITATGGGGGISGPGTTTDNAIVLWNATDGTVVQDSPITVDPVTGDMANVGDITGGALAVTSASPVSNDGAALGSGSVSWSDLFLASGALVNFANGNAVITHSSGILTVSTGDLRVTTAGTNSASCVTVGGTQTLTAKTLTSPTITTPSAFTTGGTITLAENTSIALDPAGSADGKYTGITVTGTAGYTQAFGDLVYLDPTDSRWEAADANSASGADGDARGLLGMVVSTGTDGTSCTILLEGIIRADAKFPTLTVNNPIYVSETAAAITQTQPTTTDAVIRYVGAALTADEIFFRPDTIWFSHT